MMNHKPTMEDRLESIGAALRRRPRLSGCVMDHVRESIANGSTPKLPRRTLSLRIGLHRRLLAGSAGAIAVIAAAMFVAIMPFWDQAVSWAEVTKTLQSQKWIRGNARLADGKHATMWLAPDRQVWAFRLNESFYFYDGHNKVKYEYLGGDKPITKLPLGEDDAERVLPIGALSADNSAIGQWLLGEKIVEQQRRVVREAGKPWVEFQLVLWRGVMNQVTLRVDPETRLPVYLLAASSKGSKKHVKWEFDYPEDGPADIFALGVSRDVKIDNRMPADNVLTVLTAMAASRGSMGDFRLIVGQSHGYPSSVVYRKGNKWRVDSWRPQVALDSLPSALPEEEMRKWFKEQLQLIQPMPLFVCDGQTVWENASFDPEKKPRWQVSRQTAPQDLMSGQGLGRLSKAPGAKIASLLFPDLSPKPGWGFEFDSKPSGAPDCVLIKQSAETTLPNMTAHEWYYVDPTKGYAVVRAELFTVPTGPPANPKAATALETIKMESFRQSTQGFWYPTVVHGMMPVLAGNNPPGQGQAQPLTSMTRYCFDFNTDLAESLFSVDDVEAPRK